MASLPSIPELIGLFIGVAMALALCTVLLYARGRSSGLSTRCLWRRLISIWAVVLGMLVLLFVVRAVIGTPLIEGSPVAGGLSIAQFTPAKWVLLAVTMVVMCAGALWLRRTVDAFGATPLPGDEPPPEIDPELDERC